jgi:hypothetical protein
VSGLPTLGLARRKHSTRDSGGTCRCLCTHNGLMDIAKYLDNPSSVWVLLHDIYQKPRSFKSALTNSHRGRHACRYAGRGRSDCVRGSGWPPAESLLFPSHAVDHRFVIVRVLDRRQVLLPARTPWGGGPRVMKATGYVQIGGHLEHRLWMPEILAL